MIKPTHSDYVRAFYNEKARHKYEKARLKEQRKALHNSYYATHRSWFRTLDILLVVALLLNVGAMILTNIMVVKQTPNMQFEEANPANCKQYGTCSGEGFSKYFSFLKQLILFIIIIAVYMYQRGTVYNDAEFLILNIMCLSCLIMLSFDFFNDFGYWIGVLLYGA